VRADPEPRYNFAFAYAQGTMMIAYSHHTDAVPPFLEF